MWNVSRGSANSFYASWPPEIPTGGSGDSLVTRDLLPGISFCASLPAKCELGEIEKVMSKWWRTAILIQFLPSGPIKTRLALGREGDVSMILRKLDTRFLAPDMLKMRLREGRECVDLLDRANLRSHFLRSCWQKMCLEIRRDALFPGVT